MVQFCRNATTEEVEKEFAGLRFRPYAPVMRPLFSVLRIVNRVRKGLGLGKVPVDAVRTRRRVLRAFEPGKRKRPLLMTRSDRSDRKANALC
jgi:hypothetical protein